MSDFFLDLRDTPRVIDFFVDHLELAPARVKTEAEKWIKKYHENERVSTDRLADAAKKFGWAIFPARIALKVYFDTDGREEEWQRILSSVRPSTAHLLKRFRVGTNAASLDLTLRHAEADVALREGDRLEIAEVRAHLRQDFWRDASRSLGKKTRATLVADGERRAAEYQKRFADLREIASSSSQGFQDEIFSKIARYEDRILFEGEVVPLEILDEEIAYYTDQKEISPVE
ncbi:MAG: hypothetical protein AAB879_03985 [Patescibacteria group bacterium]